VIIPFFSASLWQAGAEWSLAEFRDVDPDTIIDLRQGVEFFPDLRHDGIMTISWSFADSDVLPPLGPLFDLVDFACRRLRGGHTVLVLCYLGLNRSGLLSALIARQHLAISGSEAVEMVQRARPGSLQNETFRAYVAGLSYP
jgi:protein-tyrosine phosphatase